MANDKSELLLPAEVARLLGVNPKTVARWAQTGKLPYIRTLGGHRRFPAQAVYDLIEKSKNEGGLSASHE